MIVKVVLEKGEEALWGRVESDSGFLPVTTGKDVTEVVQNLRELITDYLQFEGKYDNLWKAVNPETVVFEIIKQ